MTDDELRTLVASNAESTRELRATVERQSEAAVIQSQGLASLQASAESQARSIESMRESMSFNTETVASALELAAESLKLSANTSRNLDRLEQNIDRLEEMMGIVIRDNQADSSACAKGDRARISGLEEQG